MTRKLRNFDFIVIKSYDVCFFCHLNIIVVVLCRGYVAVAPGGEYHKINIEYCTKYVNVYCIINSFVIIFVFLTLTFID